MCGILAILNSSDSSPAMRARALDLSNRQRHRGPDWSGLYQSGNHFLAHERLAIMDPNSGDQPLFNEDRTIVVTVNGELYNYQALMKHIRDKHPNKKFGTNSDCEVISHLYEMHGEEVASMLDGFFAFVILDTRDNSFYVARDPFGVTCMYIGWGKDGSLWVSNEMKCLKDDCTRFEQFPPGHYFSSKTNSYTRYFNPQYYLDFEAQPPRYPTGALDLGALRTSFERAVEKRLMSDVPFGVLLSGGLDSSLVASVASRKMSSHKWGNKLHSFCIGLPGSPDLLAARQVADFLGTEHHEFTFTVQDGIDAIRDVVYHVETFDVTTVRASTPMFLMSRKIKAMGVKMVLSGEGSDEVFGGYLYFHKAPSKEEFQDETVRKVQALHKYDCMRANKSTMAWGVEARVPFLDKDFVSVAMSVDPKEKMIDKASGRIEKYILRKAFDTPEKPYLPNDVLWRQKEQFSDGVGYNWIDGLKAHAEENISDQQLQNAPHRYPSNTPRTKEAYWYRSIFEEHFSSAAAEQTVPGGPSVACSTATAAAWDAAWLGSEDPSGRAVHGVHDQAYEAKVAAKEAATAKTKAANGADASASPASKRAKQGA
uniref:Asparagine synthetase [glutamine-hydrolyzing] n=1 Tax=Dunaliella tertiolecta TaxID=3047 RepID=A0A7S3R4C0_DUNTE|mmetsp:Transcript_18920/g.53003  ORF Transcript_18920/g.53003 Transcript_18920/m.53003 type:complete len:596 (+) Transcript_18920:66-1853(+)